MLNVSQGGNLFLHIPEDLPRALPHADAIDPTHRHALVVEMGTLMERVYGEGEIRVNSMHHMAIDEVAPGFAVTARCPDGVVEAIESTQGRLVRPRHAVPSAERFGVGLGPADFRGIHRWRDWPRGRNAHGRMTMPMVRLDASQHGDTRRWLAGVLVSSQGAEAPTRSW